MEGDSGIPPTRIHEIQVLIESIGELLAVPRPQIDALSARVKTDLESRRRPVVVPPIP